MFLSKRFILWIVLLFGFVGFAQLSRFHYIPPLTAVEGNSTPNQQFMMISTPSSSMVTFTVQPVGQPASSATVSQVSNSSPFVLSLGVSYTTQLFIPLANTGTVTTDEGYYVEADEPIYVSIRYVAGDTSPPIDNSPQAGAFVSKGIAALGKEFRTAGFTNSTSVTIADQNYVTFTSVMAIEDDTEVTIDNLDPALQLEPSTTAIGVTSFTFTLNRFESYTIAARVAQGSLVRPPENRNGLIGVRVKSDKDIVVNVGSANGSMGRGTGRDQGVDQIIGTDKIGSEYIFIEGDPSGNGVDADNVLIVAHEDNTNIFLNGSSVASTTLMAGEFFEIENDVFSSVENLYVRTSKDVYAYRNVVNGNSANQSLFFVPPLDCAGDHFVNNIPSISLIGTLPVTSGQMTIIAGVSDTITFSDQDNTNANVTDTSFAGGVIRNGPNAVTGQASYVTYRLDNLDGNVTVSSTGKIYLSYYTLDGAATSGSFYSGFQNPPVIEVDSYRYASEYGDCSDRVVLGISNRTDFDSFQWYGFNYDSASWEVPTTIAITNSATLRTNNQYRRYRVDGTISCNTKTYTSMEYYVPVCPADLDQDGVIDNVDLDLENDGIDNIVESLGDASINLTTIISPIVIFSDASTNTSLTGTFTTVNGTLTGDSSGTFNSTLPAGDHSLTYTHNYVSSLANLDFMNFYLEESNSISSTRSADEYFTLATTKYDTTEYGKTITVIDNGGELLIDTDHDGVYESGLTSFTSEEIRFKWSGTVSSSQFYFKSHEITEIEFTHEVKNSTATSTFAGQIELRYYYVSSYVGLSFFKVGDYINYDSDNDGCDDVLEAGFTDGNSTAVFGDPDYNNKGKLGTNTPTVDSLGRVVGAGGYLTPSDANSNTIFDFQENTSPPSISASPTSQYICLGEDAVFEVTPNVSNIYSFQWQIDSGGIWLDLANTVTQTGVNSTTLTLINPPISLDTQAYRVVISAPQYACSTAVSAVANLYITDAGWAPVSPSLILSEGGSSTTFGLALSDQPTSTVVVAASVSPTSQLSVSPTLFTFTVSDWSVTQSGTLFAIDDSIADGAVSATLTFSVSDVLSNACYVPLGDLVYNLQVLDNEIPGFSVTAISSDVVEDSSSTATFSIVLDVEPTSNVIIDLTNGDVTEISMTVTQLLFTPLNWNVPQVVTVAGVSDTLVDGDITTTITLSISSGPSVYTALASQTVSVITLDDDTAGFTVTAVSSNVLEDPTSTASFTVVLNSQPVSNVIIDLTNGDGTEISMTVTQLLFTPLNWNVPQVVTVAGVSDTLVDGDITTTITLSISSGPSVYTALASQTVSVITLDDDTAGFTVTAVSSNVLEDPTSTASFTVVLNSQPVSNVIIDLTNGDGTEISMTVTQLLFTPLNWNVPQVVTVAGVSDTLVDGDITTTITLSISSGPSVYTALASQTVSVITLDDDTAGFTVTAVSSNVLEDPTSTASFTVVLNSQPVSNVIIDLTNGDGTEISMTVTQLLFTPLNWNVPQVVTVAGVSDTLVDGDITTTITLSISSGPHTFLTLANQTLAVTTLDDDTAPTSPVASSGSSGSTSSSPSSTTTSATIPSNTASSSSTTVTTVEADNGTATETLAGNVETELDSDGDSVPDALDVDDDNDGILDIVEGNQDVDSDGIPNRLDLDSDGDGCLDVVEAGFEDGDANGLLGTGELTINQEGQVETFPGYTSPMDADANLIFDFLEAPSDAIAYIQNKRIPIVLDTPLYIPLVTSAVLSVSWEFSIDYDPILQIGQWNPIDDLDVIVNQTETGLRFENPKRNWNNYAFRAFYRFPGDVCDPGAYTNAVQLYVTPLRIPNAISPNGDGTNDQWEIEGLLHFTQREVTIYNREGLVVYQSLRYENDWSGISNVGKLKSGTQLPEGTYFYVLKLGNRDVYKGFIYVRR